MSGPSPEELTAGVVICPACHRIGAGACICGLPDAEYAEAMWSAAIKRDAPRADAEPAGPRPCPPGYARHTTTAPVICLECGDPVRWHDGYRHADTLDGLHYRCPGAKR
jgi:hypothetical protein